MTEMVEDHRIRVAAQRRDKMRRRLLEAVMSTYAARLQQGPPPVDDVVGQANVSRATFYKYFNSVEEAIAELGQELVDEMVASLISLYGDTDDAFFRLTTGILLFLLRSLNDPLWAAFVARTDHLAQDTEPLRGITTHLTTARAAGVVNFDDTEAASSLVVGAMMEAIRYMAKSDRHQRNYVEDLTAMTLRGLGVNIKIARKVVSERTRFIREVAPNRLPWWDEHWL